METSIYLRIWKFNKLENPKTKQSSKRYSSELHANTTLSSHKR